MSATATVNPDLSIALSTELQEALDLAPGQTLVVERRGDVLEFRRATRAAPGLIGLLSRYAPATPVSAAEMSDAVSAEAADRSANSGRTS